MNADRSLVAKGQRPVKQAMLRGVRWMKANPLLSKSVPTAIGFVFGDILTQYGQRKGNASWFDVKKTAKMLAVGATVAGPIGLGILLLPGSSPGLVGLKVIADQAVGCIIWQAAYIQINAEYRAAALNLLKTVQDAAQDQQTTLKRRLQAC